MREGYRSNFLKRFGRLVDVDAVENDEALNITLDQEEMKIEDAYVSLIGMSEEERKPFIGKKIGDKMEVDINELYTNPAQRAAILHVKENELEGINPKFTLEITKIRKFAEPEIDEEFFNMAFPEGQIKTKEEFEQHIDAQIALELSRETDFLFNLDLRDFLIKKAGLSMPEEFLKSWLFIINEGKFPIEEIERDFPKFLDMMRWNLIQKHYIKEFGLEVTPTDMIEEAKNTARAQFAYYGMGQVADDMLENYANSILQNKDERSKIREKLSEEKVVGAVTPLIGITEKPVSAEEFQKLVSKE
jgi:trigger factor